MTRKRKIKKKSFFMLVIVLIIGIGVVYLLKGNLFNIVNNSGKPGDEKTVTSFVNKISYDTKVKERIDPKAEYIIVTLMDLYYRSMKELNAYDVTNLFDESAYEQAEIMQTALTLLIDIRMLQTNDLSLAKCSYDIEYTNIVENNEELIITYKENNSINFNFMKDIISKSYGIENKITLRKVNNDYKIIAYEKVDDFYQMIADNYDKSDKSKTEVVSSLTNIKGNILLSFKKTIRELEEKRASRVNGEESSLPTCDHPYDRDKAVSYAKAWINKRNSEWVAYDSLGGNCNNYASQAILAGGIPMDYTGPIAEQWKHYSSTVNEAEVAEGRSYSWTGVNPFYVYAKSNKGFGMCAKVDANMYTAEPGDIIQTGPTKGMTHTVIVTDVIKKDGKVIEILIGSNSIDRENYPLSAYNYPNKRLIKIYGWND